MKKKLNLTRIFLVILAVLSVCSCIREDLLQPDNTKGLPSKGATAAKYVSKSLWQEDDVYIAKIQQVFLKAANLEKVKETYGELYWNYAMSFGQFGEKYLLVPVVKKDKVVLLMEAVRKGNRVYFYEKDDADLLGFFQHVLYSNILSHSEVIDGAAAKSKYVCSTRTIVIGCLNGQTDCEPLSYSQMVCEWKEGGNGGPPHKSFDPLGDPFSGGGGGGGSSDDGHEYPDPPEDPCEKNKQIITNPGIQNKIKDVREKADSNGRYEFGFKVNVDGTSTEVTQGPVKGEWEVGSLAGIKGFYHSHPDVGIQIFSPNDIQSFFRTRVTSGTPSTVSDIFIGVIGAKPCSCPGGKKYFHYMIRYEGSLEDAGTVTFTDYNMIDIIKDYQERENKLTSILPTSPYSDDGGVSLNYKGVEKLFFDTLDRMNIDKTKMVLQRIENDGTINTIMFNNNGIPTEIPCPN